MAECLQNDIHAALESWRTVNSSSDAIIPHEDDGTGTDDGDGSLALSTSEWRVVERVIAGCTNAQAAEALYLSKRTVDTHLRNIYGRHETKPYFSWISCAVSDMIGTCRLRSPGKKPPS